MESDEDGYREQPFGLSFNFLHALLNGLGFGRFFSVCGDRGAELAHVSFIFSSCCKPHQR